MNKIHIPTVEKDMDKIIDNMIRNNKISNWSIASVLKDNGHDLTPQQIRQYIRKLRLEGKPIIADNKGYWYAKTQVELDQYRATRIKELNNERHVLKKMYVAKINK